VLRSNIWYHSLPLALALILLVFIGDIVYTLYFSAPRSVPLTDPPTTTTTGPFAPR